MDCYEDYYAYTIENTVQPLAWFCASFAGLWLLALSVGHFAGGGTLSGLLQIPWPVLFGIPLVMGICLLYCYIATLFCIRVEDGFIRYLFLKKYVLREARLEDLKSIQKLGWSRYSGIRLHFADGQEITPFFKSFKDGHRLTRDLQKMTGKNLLRKH